MNDIDSVFGDIFKPRNVSVILHLSDDEATALEAMLAEKTVDIMEGRGSTFDIIRKPHIVSMMCELLTQMGKMKNGPHEDQT
jgi:hypothetical protein